MPLLVHDTRARGKVPFDPLTPGRVTMYVCGPTVYDDPHVGHARLAVAFDVIRRALEWLGHRVTYVQNITDVDDKILNRAAEENALPWEIADRYTRAYEDAMRALGVRPPTIAPRATGHITDMLHLIGTLVDSGVAYVVEGGDVYFSVESFAGYGGLSRRSLEDMRAGERVEPDPRKRHPMDFALWKSAKEGQVQWPSPWGPGRPGWHIECSAMSTKYLGEAFDIHGGGEDLIFPHHENEAAQSQAASGAPFARYWLHNAFITVNAEKMSKSLGNFTTLPELLAEHAPPVVRTLLAAVHYRSPVELSPDVLVEARGVWDRLATFARNASLAIGGRAPETTTDEGWRARFREAIEDDFNAAQAVAVLHELISEANPLIDAVDAGDEPATLAVLLATFRELAGVLGLDPIGDWPSDRRHAAVAPLVEHMLAAREDARARRDFGAADGIRDVLARAGVVVEDRPAGARWHLADPWTT